MDGLRHDLRFARRGLTRRYGTSFVLVLTIGLAIGANAAVFSVVRPVLLESLPYGNADRLVRVGPDGLLPHSKAEVLAMEAGVPAFAEVAAWGRALYLLGGDQEPEEVRGARVFANHFSLLGVEPLLGSGFRPGDGEPGAPPVVVLSHRLWERRFGSDPGLIGRDIYVNGSPRTVVGILDRLHHPIEYDWEVWSVMSRDPAEDEHRGLAMNALLAAGATIPVAEDQARQALIDYWRSHGVESGDEDPTAGGVMPLATWAFGEVAMPLTILSAGVAFVLLLACANVANLLTSLGNTRAAELAIREALGAGRGRIARLLTLEFSLVGLFGWLLGLGLAWTAVYMGRALLPAGFPRLESIQVGGGVMVFAAGLAAVSTLLFGSGPLLSSRRRSLAHGMRSGGRAASAGIADRRVQSTLVAVQVGLAVLLVTGSALTLRSLWKLTRVDPGFDASQVVVFRPSPPGDRYETEEEIVQYNQRVLAEVGALGQVSSVGAIQFLPMTPGGWNDRYEIPERPLADQAIRPGLSMRVVSGEYFRTLSIPLLSGRVFAPDDDEAMNIVVNEALAGEAWPGEDPIGRTILISETPFTVVGVVGGARQRTLANPSTPEAYVPHAVVPWGRMWIAAKIRGPAEASLAQVTAAARRVDGDVAMTGTATLESVVSRTTADARFFALALSGLGGMALLIGAVGVYGVLSQLVSQSVRDIGVRMAFGADRGAVLRLTIRQGLTPVVLGIAAGMGLAAVGTGTLEALLYGVAPLDPTTFLVVPILLLAVGILAAWLPARRAAGTQPVTVLNSE